MTARPSLHEIVALAGRWFDELPEAIRHDVLTHARRRALTPGERLYSRGDRPDGIYCVVDGSVRVSGISREGQQTVLDFYGPGSWFGEVSMLGGTLRAHDAEGYMPTSLLQIVPEDLEKLLAVHPALTRALLRLEAMRLYLLLTALEQYSVQSMEQRLASRLLMLAGSYGANGPRGFEIGLHLPQETLAQLVGATRQRINQLLKNWELQGVVEQQYGRILLLDRAALEKLARM